MDIKINNNQMYECILYFGYYTNIDYDRLDMNRFI